MQIKHRHATLHRATLPVSYTHLLQNINMPIGIIAIPITFTSLSRERIISVCCFFLDAFASRVIFDAYDESPTFSRTAKHSPDTTKLPDNSISPFFFVISSDSVSYTHLNEETQFVFKNLGIKPPEYMRDVRPQVKDVDIHFVDGVDENLSLIHI